MKPYVLIVSPHELSKMETRQLLSRRNALLRLEDSFDEDEWGPQDIAVPDAIFFKRTPEWRKARAELRAVLQTREHVPTGDERKKKRLARAKRNKSSERRSR